MIYDLFLPETHTTITIIYIPETIPDLTSLIFYKYSPVIFPVTHGSNMSYVLWYWLWICVGV